MMQRSSINAMRELCLNDLYAVFKKYRFRTKFEDRCSPYVNATSNVGKLFFCQSLKCLTLEDFGTYPNRAITSMGNVEDFKHFLPRFLELKFYNKYGWHWLHSKLQMEESDFFHWPSREIQAVLNYLIFLTIYDEDCQYENIDEIIDWIIEESAIYGVEIYVNI